jgi:hypothetical protein
MVGNYTQSQDNRIMMNSMKALEINGGRVDHGEVVKLTIPASESSYADAQLDDYHGHRRKDFRWHSGCELTLRARFSHEKGEIVGTAGFGFWNAPFGDPSYRWPALPKASWFFYASNHSDLPFAPQGPGRGWFVSTIDGYQAKAIVLAPFAPFLIILNNVPRLRRTIWPFIRRQLKISYRNLDLDMASWHSYRLSWTKDNCEFWVDEQQVYMTSFSPSGPMGFVCWIDNQYLVAKPTGAFRWGTIPLEAEQWLEISDLDISSL